MAYSVLLGSKKSEGHMEPGAPDVFFLNFGWVHADFCLMGYTCTILHACEQTNMMMLITTIVVRIGNKQTFPYGALCQPLDHFC